MQEDPEVYDEYLEEESFWPSFTDIMMVVTMIFLMVMIVLVLKNNDLIQKLQQSVVAEKESQLQVASKTSELRDLLQRLSQVEEENSRLNLKSLQQQEDNFQLQENINQLKLKTRNLFEEKKLLQSSLDNLHLDLTQEQKKQSQQQIVINTAITRIKKISEAQNTLQNDYDRLQMKYRKLIKPARTPKGKKIATITYTKIGTKTTIRLKKPGESKSESVTQTQLHQHLINLQKKFSSLLYVKVIFPEGSQVSHREAWQFTTQVLQRYDYYYQEGKESSTQK